MKPGSTAEALIVFGGLICMVLLMIGNAILWSNSSVGLWGWRFFWYMVTTLATIGCLIAAAVTWLP